VIVGLCRLSAGSAISVTGVGQVVIWIHRHTGRAELNASWVSLVSAANGGSVGNKRPNRPAHRRRIEGVSPQICMTMRHARPLRSSLLSLIGLAGECLGCPDRLAA
jgi:hypothetical protein